MACLYVVVLILASFLPARVNKSEFGMDDEGKATLLVRNKDKKIMNASSYHGADAQSFFRFRKLLDFDDEDMDEHEMN